MREKKRELEVVSLLSNHEHVQCFVYKMALEHMGREERLCPLLVSVEEVFTNICKYAYGNGRGPVRVEAVWGSGFLVSVNDRGKPFNPLRREPPELLAPADKRVPGGLGLLMVQRYMARVLYEYADGWNILTLVP